MIKEIPMWKIKLLFNIEGKVTKVQFDEEKHKLCIQYKRYRKNDKENLQLENIIKKKIGNIQVL